MSTPLSHLPPSSCPRCGRPIPAHAVLGACPHCLLATGLASEPAAPNDPPPPSPAELAIEFPQLEVLELLGRGGMGAVYKARQRALDRLVALKLLRPGLDADPTFAERFTREARALAGLNHPGIVTLYEFGRTPGGRFFILMEFVDGVNLRQLLAAGRLAPREALAIIPPLCDALQYAHDRGLVHRDIKPENILVDRLGRVKVADFGLAKLAAESGIAADVSGDKNATSTAVRGTLAFDLTEAGKVIGTPRYMSPEQRERPNEVDHRADIYALGVVLYQMLTGELPDAQQLQPPSRRVQLDVRLDEIVLRAMEKEPALRYQHASAMKTQVENVTQSSRPAAAATFATTRKDVVATPESTSVRDDHLEASAARSVTVVAAMFVAFGIYSGWLATHNFPGGFGIPPTAIALPIGLGLWRFRPWWRITALVFLGVGFVLAATGIVIALSPLQQVLDHWLANYNAHSFPPIEINVRFGAGLFMAALSGGMAWVLCRPGTRMLFEENRGWSRPWQEWAGFATALFLLFSAKFFFDPTRPSPAVPRTEALGVQSSRTADQAKPAPTNATPVINPSEPALTETQREILELKLQQAQRAVTLIQSRYDAGLADNEEVATAKDGVALLQAELNGDVVQAAQVKLAAAGRTLKIVAARAQAGVATNADAEAAKTNVAISLLEMNAMARAKGVAVPESTAPLEPQKAVSTTTVKSPPAKETAGPAPTVSSQLKPRLQFRAVLKSDEPNSETLSFMDRHESLYLSRTVLLDEKALQEVSVRPGTREDSHEIELHFNAAGAARFTEITRTLAGRRLAILFDGHILVAPTIHAAITGGTAQISGRMTAVEAESLASALREAMGAESPSPTPPVEFAVNVFGKVVHPATFQLRPGSTLLDALGAAGGWSGNANLEKISIVHRDSAGNRTATTFHDVNAILKGNAANPGLVADDTVVVPDHLF